MIMRHLAALLACITLSAAAVAQPARPEARRQGPAPAQQRAEDAPPPAPPAPPTPASPPAMTAEALRERLDRRLLELQQEEAAIVRAQSELQRGVAPGEVMRTLMRDRAFTAVERFRDGPGPRGQEEHAEVEYDPQRLREMMRFLRETAPQVAERIEAEILDNPDRAEQVYRRMAPRMLPQMEMRERDPEMFSIRAESMRLDWQIRQVAQSVRRVNAASDAPAEESARVNAILRELVAKRVDIAQRERALMIDRLEQRVASMRADLTTSAADRDSEVDQKVRELLADERDPRPRPPHGDVRGPRRD